MNSAMVRQSWLHLVVAFAAMGSWSLFANRAHPLPVMLLAGVVQGSLSASITFVMKRLIEALVSRLPGIKARLLPPAICCGLSVSLLSTIHTIARTPELLMTILLPVTVATSYAVIYTQTLCSARKASP